MSDKIANTRFLENQKKLQQALEKYRNDSSTCKAYHESMKEISAYVKEKVKES